MNNPWKKGQAPRQTQLARGFTLVELLVVVAIISALAAVALPAYNNYSLKAKFAEAVVASAPLKTFISACAASGDCIVSNAIYLGGATATASGGASSITPSATPANVLATSKTADNVTEAAIYGYLYAVYSVNNAQPAATAAANAQNNMASLIAGGYWVGACAGFAGKVCLRNNAHLSSDYIGAVAPAAVTAAYANSDPYVAGYSSGAATQTTGPAVSAPCVGAGEGCSPATKYVASVSNDASGVITATAQATSGLNAETFVLIPSYSSGRIDWAASGSCKTRAGGALC